MVGSLSACDTIVSHAHRSVIEIDTTDPQQPALTVELFVDGSRKWRCVSSSIA